MIADLWPKRLTTKPNSVRHILMAGIFWRILIIEIILLALSLGYRAATEPTDAADLFWYALRILILVGIIIIFVTFSLSRFLNRKIIAPLEAIVRANMQLDIDAPEANPVVLASHPPDEINQIVDTRQRMLASILKVSEERLRLVNFIRDTFGRYLSQKVVERILASPEARELGGRRTTVTILMADLRGFTSFSETHDPEKILALLNRFFGAMAEIIYAYDGMIDEFLGDGILAIFGVPERHEDDPFRAVACAIEMQNRLSRLRKEITDRDFSALQMGIGINTGSVVVGNIGSKIRAKYGIVGMPVNTASRIESITTGGQVLIGEATYTIVHDSVAADAPQSIMMKGLRRPLVCYPVKKIEKPRTVSLDVQQENSEHIPIQLPLKAWVINSKTIEHPCLQGRTLAMNGEDLSIELSTTLPLQTQLKLQFQFCLAIHCFGDIYANVVDMENGGPGAPSIYHLKITAIDHKDRKLLDDWIREAL